MNYMIGKAKVSKNVKVRNEIQCTYKVKGFFHGM